MTLLLILSTYMSGHSKWNNIKNKKQAQDKLRGKIFTIHAKLIALAAQKEADPAKNPSLAEAIVKAKKDNVPLDNIERAIAKGSGKGKDADQISEIIYEGYSVAGVGVVVKALTDNKNRTASNIRHHFTKNGGNLAETGSLTSFAFRLAGVCYIPSTQKINGDALEEILFESCAQDFTYEDDGFVKITSEKNDLGGLVKYLKEKGVEIDEYKLTYIPNNTIPVDDIEKGMKIYKLIEDLQEDDDVEEVWSNEDISAELQEMIEKKLEESSFSF